MTDEESDGEETKVLFSGAQCHTVVPNNPEVILDSGLSISLVKDKVLFVNKKTVKCKDPIIMETNAGNKKIDEQGKVVNYGTLFYDETALANIFGMSDMVRKGNRVFIYTDFPGHK